MGYSPWGRKDSDMTVHGQRHTSRTTSELNARAVTLFPNKVTFSATGVGTSTHLHLGDTVHALTTVLAIYIKLILTGI